MSATEETRWLDQSQQHSWRALMMGVTLLLDRLDEDLQREFNLSLPEYEILVRLSERPHRCMRMAHIADSMAHSRSRVTHTITRMERAGLVARSTSPDDGRGIVATMTDEGFSLLEKAARSHVEGVRRYIVDISAPEDFEAMGRVMDAVSDFLVARHPEAEIR